MNYYLMHKNIPVAFFSLDENDNQPTPKSVQLNPKAKRHLPIGGQMNNMKFIEWWKDRAIPKTRQGAVSALERLGYKNTTSAMVNNLCLSLNDCYWIKPQNSSLSWEDVNLFKNDFTDTFGELTFNRDADVDLRQNTTFLKAITSQGEVQKKWCIDTDGRRFLIKGNYGPTYQQSINEILATRLHEAQNWQNFTRYYFTKIQVEGNQEGLGCFSYNFCSENIESVSAWELLQTIKYKQNESLFFPFKKLCLEHGIKEDEFNYFMDYQIMSDFLISNTDRHMNNISILRDPDSLEFIKIAPIYDSGNSMFFRTPTDQLYKIHLGQEKVHSFITSKEVNLLKYVKDRTVLNMNKVDLDFSVYQKDVEDMRARGQILREMYERKALILQAFQLGKNVWEPNKSIFMQNTTGKTENKNIDTPHA